MKNNNQNDESFLKKVKTKFMNEAWEYFKKAENLPLNTDRLTFELITKAEDIGERWGAFKHTYTSAAFTQKYGTNAAKILGDLNEIKQFGSAALKKNNISYAPGNEPQDRRMDLKNNSAGREIGSRNSGLNLLDEVYYELDRNPYIVLNQYKNNDESYKDNALMNAVWSLADKSYKNKDNINNTIKEGVERIKKIKNTLTGGAANLDEKTDTFEEPKSLRQKLLESREEKLARYTQRLGESSEKVAERKASHISLEELKAPQEARKQRVRDIIEGRVEFDEKTDLSAYVNKESKDNKIFTQEDIDSMSEEEKEKNKEAIFYQKQTIGIPTKEQADKAGSNGGMVYVSSSTRSDGTKVKSYYRSR